MLFNSLAFLPGLAFSRGLAFLDVVCFFSQKMSGNPATAHCSQRQTLLYGFRSK